jgi:hypothetical protein
VKTYLLRQLFNTFKISHFSDLINTNESDIVKESNNFELYFEEEDLDSFLQKLRNIDPMEYVYGLKEQPWGQ